MVATPQTFVATTIGRVAIPKLADALVKTGADKFVKLYGQKAFEVVLGTAIGARAYSQTEEYITEYLNHIDSGEDENSFIPKSSMPDKTRLEQMDAMMAVPDRTPFAGDLKVPGIIAPDATEMEKEAKKIRDMTKSVGFPSEPPIKVDTTTGDSEPPKIETTEEFPIEDKPLPKSPGFGEGDKIDIPIITYSKNSPKDLKDLVERSVGQEKGEKAIDKLYDDSIFDGVLDSDQLNRMKQLEENYTGGLNDLGDAGIPVILENTMLDQHEEYMKDYKDALANAIRETLGNEFKAYRLMEKEDALKMLTEGEFPNIKRLQEDEEGNEVYKDIIIDMIGQETPLSREAFSFSLSPKEALSFRFLSAGDRGSKKDEDFVLIEMKASPTDIVMRGHESEKDLILRVDGESAGSSRVTPNLFNVYDIKFGEKNQVQLSENKDYKNFVDASKNKLSNVSAQTKDLVPEKPEFGGLTETEKQTAQALMGDKPEFYSRAVDAIKNAKQNKFTKGKWKSIVQSNSTKEEMDYLGLSKYLQGNESISKQDLLDFVEQKNIADKLSVVEVPLEDQHDFSQFSIGGAGGKMAVSSQIQMQQIQPGYKSTVKQYVFQVDGSKQWSADTAHFLEKYAKNAIAHARAQIGYFDADAVEKRLNAKEADGVKLSNDDKILKSASRQLEDTFIIDEIQSDMIQQIQEKGTKEDFIIIKGKDITSDFLEKNYPDYTVKPTPVNILTGKTDKQLKDEGLITIRDNPNVLYITDRTTGISSPEVRLMSNNFYVFDKNTLVTKGSYKTEEAAQKVVDNRGLNPLPITESKKYVELVLNAMIKKAVEKDLDSIGITNGQIQYDRYEGQSGEDKEGLKKFYDEIVFKQLEKVANKYGVELETVELPGKTGPKDFDDIGLNEPTEASDARTITRRTTRALRDGFVLRKIKYHVLARTIENLIHGTVDGDPIGEDYIGGRENAVLPDYASIFTRTGRGAGETFLDTLINNNINEDSNYDLEYYIWVKPDTKIDEAISRANAGELASVARAWDIRNLNLQMPVSQVVPSGGTDINSYNSYISEYFSGESFNIKYPHEIIKMKLPKKLQKESLSKPIKLSKAKKQTDRLLA